MKSLDALINYLLEEVALCGKQGAGPAEVFEHVTAFYAKPSGFDSDRIVDIDSDEATDTITIDRPFQEQVWKWLVSHPECRVESRPQGGKPSRSEVEATNHALRKHEAVANQAPPKPGVSQEETQISPAQKDTNRVSSLISKSANGSPRMQPMNEPKGLPESFQSPKLHPSDQPVDRLQDAYGEIRVYASEERMWHALTGHGVDYAQVPSLDFACLSIIAAAGPKGITQPELVKLSDQDKRSVPRRTQNLLEKGYITKTPILSGAARTCICTLKRFIPSSDARKSAKDDGDEEPKLDIDGQVIFQQCFPAGGANLYLLLRNIFDALNRFKMITLEDLRIKLGLPGHPWERRIFASTLRKLEAVGCVKQVRAQAHGLGDRSKYFRCLKLIREPGENESQQLCGLAHVDLRFVSTGQGEDLDSESEVGEDIQARQNSGSIGIHTSEAETTLKEVRRPISQWTGSGCINNFFYYLIERTGTLGLSTMDIKEQAFGRLVSRPVENQLARIVDHWQLSQPTHLRHLAIIRDTAMAKTKTHYVHYTYDNFKRLVENGEATWEAVSVLGSDDKNMQQPALAVQLKADLDEYGFPKIPTTVFQGRHNDATLSQCVNAIVVVKPTITKKDPVVRELGDGTYEVHHAVKSHWLQRKFALKPVVVSPSVKAIKDTPRPKGRPRKVPLQADSSGELTSAQSSIMIKSNNAAIRYQKQKVEKEIAKRIEDGEDPNDVRKNIFAMVSAKYLAVREDIPASIKELRIGDTKLSGEPASSKYLPSVTAHTQTIPMSLECTSDRVSHDTGQVSTRLPKKFLSQKGSEKADLTLKPKGSLELTYDEQANLIGREDIGVFVGADALRARTPGQRGRSRKCRLAIFKSARLSDLSWFSEEIVISLGDGLTHDEQANLIRRENFSVFVGADALRARTPGQRGRSRKCRLAIFKSARLSDFPWFSEEIVISLGDKDSTPVCDESRLEARALSPYLSRSTRATRKQISPPVVELSKSSLAEDGDTDTPKHTHIASSLDCRELSEDRSTGLHILDQVRISDHTECNRSPVAPLIERDIQASAESGHVSPAPYGEEPCTLFGSSPNISPFTPISQGYPKIPTEGADTEAEFHPDKEKVLPLNDVSKSPVTHMIIASAEEETTSFPGSPGAGVQPAPIIVEASHRISTQTEVHDVANGQSDVALTTPAQTSSALNSLPPIPDGTGINAPGETMQTSNRRTKLVTISGGSVSVVRKNIIMDIMHMCGGIYSGHKELEGPFTAAWAKQNKPGKPDSKTIYTTFRSLIQSGKLRELKFSFQTPEGLMVTKSMITLTSISPTDHRVLEMQKLIIACHPSQYIPEGVEIPEEVRNQPVFPGRFGTSRTVADLEIDNESQVRLQHKPLYITRLEEKETAAEKRRQIRQARLETMRVEQERPIRRVRFSGLANRTGARPKVERLATIRMPNRVSNRNSGIRSNTEIPHFNLADTDLDHPYLSSGGSSAEDEGVDNSEEVSSLRDKRKRAPSAGYGAEETADVSRADKTKRRRLNGSCRITPSLECSAHTLRQISTVMDPEQSFHAANGTFSATFSILKNLQPETERVGNAKLGRKKKTDFETEIDELLNRELATSDFLNSANPERSFINHQLLQPHLTPVETEYTIDPDFQVKFMGQPSRRIDKPSANLASKNANDFDDGSNNVKGKKRPLQPLKITRKRKRRDSNLKTRRLTALGEANALVDFNALEEATPTSISGARPSKLRKVRGPHKQPPMTRDDEERLLAAVVAIRTITGGVERNPDWVLIASLFQPVYSQMYIQKKWSNVLKRYRLQMDQIQANFQEKFAKAYEDNEIPTIDFDHLEDYDWDWLVEWTLDNIDTSWDSFQHLPSERSELDAHFQISASANMNISEYFEIESSTTWQRREAMVNKVSYVYPAGPAYQLPPNTGAEEVAIARTWVRANIIAPAASYEPDLARAKLSVLNEHSVDEALQELLSARLLSQSNKGRLVPGRNYDISEYFVSRLRKKLNIAHFRRAAAFKRRLDEIFSEQTTFIVPYKAANGDMMAVLNMLAFGRVTIRPKNPPMEKFGLTDGGYRTRRMDKSRMNFDVEIRKAPTYITGNPLAPIPSPPCQHLEHPMAKIPLWYDIHGQLVPIMWDILLAATLSLLGTKSNISAAEIEQSVRPSAELWELELLLDWMVKAGVATSTGQGVYTVTEWWWMCLGEQ